MPLVKLFARKDLTKAIPLAALQARMCQIWGTKPDTTKLLLFRCEDWTTTTTSPDPNLPAQEEDVYVDIRAYGKAERTREFVMSGMADVQRAFADHGLVANVRLETYDGDRYFHLPPPPPPPPTTTP